MKDFFTNSFYNGYFRPFNIKLSSDNCSRLREEFLSVYDDLDSVLSKNDGKKLERLCEIQTEIENEHLALMFTRGFHIGVGLTAESLLADESER